MCSKLFGKGTLDSYLGDIIGGAAGFLVGGPGGAAIGAGLGGAAGSALGGGSLSQDIQAGGLGAALAGGGSSLAADVATGAVDAGAEGAGELAAGIGADTGATFADSLTPATLGTVSGPIDAGVIDAGAAPAVVAAAPAAISAAPAVTSAPAAALPAFADPTSLAAEQGGSLFTGALDTTPAASGAVAPAASAATGLADPLAASEATFAPQAFTPSSFGLTAGELGSPATTAGGVGNWLGTQADKLGTYVSDHPFQAAGTALSALGLGRSALASQNPNPIPGMSSLSTLANQLGSTGAGLIGPNATAAGGVANNATSQARVLEDYLTSGTLPPAIQASLDQATQDGITNIRAQYAARGMPPGSSAEVQETNALKQRAVIQGGTLAAQLFSQGVSLDQLAAQIYSGLVNTGGSLTSAGAGAQESLINTGVALNTGVNNSIANLSSALGGGSRAIINGNTVTLPAAA